MSCCFRCRCPSLLQTFFFLVCFFLSPAPILSAFVSVASVVFLVVCCFCHTLDWCLFPDLALTLPLGCLALCVGAGEEGSPLLRCVITPSPNTLFWFPLLVLVLPVQLLGANGTFSLSFLSFFFLGSASVQIQEMKAVGRVSCAWGALQLVSAKAVWSLSKITQGQDAANRRSVIVRIFVYLCVLV